MRYNTRFRKNDPVWIRRLGSSYPSDFQMQGEVVGISANEADDAPWPAHYIVRLVNKQEFLQKITHRPFADYSFDYITITGACLDEREVQ